MAENLENMNNKLSQDDDPYEKDAEDWKRIADEGDALVSELEESKMLPKPVFNPHINTEIGKNTEKIEPEKNTQATPFDPEDNDRPAWEDPDEEDALLSSLKK